MKNFSKAILLSAIFFAPTLVFAYPDVSSKHESARAIEYMRIKNIMIGNPNGTFKPDSAVNRAELMKILVTAEGLNESDLTAESCYPDVLESDWFSPYVCYASSRGWVKGYPDGLFRPAQSVNFVESLKMIEEARFPYLPFAHSVNRITYFSQKEYERNWYDTYLSNAISNGLITQQVFDRDGQAIDGPTPRKRIAEILYRSFLIEGNVSWPVDFSTCDYDYYADLHDFTTYYLPDGTESTGQQLTLRDFDDNECTLSENINPYDRISKDFGTRDLAVISWAYDGQENTTLFSNGPIRDSHVYFLDSHQADTGNADVWELSESQGVLRQVATTQGGSPYILTDDNVLFSQSLHRIYAVDLLTGRYGLLVEAVLPLLFENKPDGLEGFMALRGDSIFYKVYEASYQLSGGPFTFVEELSKKISDVEFFY
jgi:hypothetical protein